jgi:hypothetical protein
LERVRDRPTFLPDPPVQVLKTIAGQVVAATPIANGSEEAGFDELLQVGGGDPFAHVGVFDVVRAADSQTYGGVVEGSHGPLVQAGMLPFAVDGLPESF